MCSVLGRRTLPAKLCFIHLIYLREFSFIWTFFIRYTVYKNVALLLLVYCFSDLLFGYSIKHEISCSAWNWTNWVSRNHLEFGLIALWFYKLCEILLNEILFQRISQLLNIKTRSRFILNSLLTSCSSHPFVLNFYVITVSI